MKDVNDNRARVEDYPEVISVKESAKTGTKLFNDKKSYTFKGNDADVSNENNRVYFEIKSPRNSPFMVQQAEGDFMINTK